MLTNKEYRMYIKGGGGRETITLEADDPHATAASDQSNRELSAIVGYQSRHSLATIRRESGGENPSLIPRSERVKLLTCSYPILVFQKT